MNSILKILVFRLIWIRSVYNFDEGLTHETSVLKLFMVANYIVNSVDRTKLSCYNSPPTQHHSFFRNLPLYIILVICTSQEFTLIFECATLVITLIISSYWDEFISIQVTQDFKNLYCSKKPFHFREWLTFYSDQSNFDFSLKIEW